MTRSELIEWLLSDAGPLLQYRTARDLITDYPQSQLAELRKQIVNDLEIGIWLKRLENCANFHNGTNDRFENIMGRLVDFGLDRSFPELEQRLLRFRRLLAEWSKGEPKGMMQSLNTIILTLRLARAGYVDDPVVLHAAKRRLTDIHEAVKTKDYDIFYPEALEPKKPPHFKNMRVIRERYAPGGKFLLPYIYDIHLAAAFPPGFICFQAVTYASPKKVTG